MPEEFGLNGNWLTGICNFLHPANLIRGAALTPLDCVEKYENSDFVDLLTALH
jgi:hypothetical protein